MRRKFERSLCSKYTQTHTHHCVKTCKLPAIGAKGFDVTSSHRSADYLLSQRRFRGEEEDAGPIPCGSVFKGISDGLNTLWPRNNVSWSCEEEVDVWRRAVWAGRHRDGKVEE